jgi:hypothetical protein
MNGLCLKTLIIGLMLQEISMPLNGQPQPLGCPSAGRNTGKVYLWIDFKPGDFDEVSWRPFADGKLSCTIAQGLNTAISPSDDVSLSPIEVVPIRKPDAEHIPRPAIRVILSAYNREYWLELDVFFDSNVGTAGIKGDPVTRLKFNTHTQVSSLAEVKGRLLSDVPAVLTNEFPDKLATGFPGTNAQQLIWRVVKLGDAELTANCPSPCQFDLQLGWKADEAGPIARAKFRIQRSKDSIWPSGDLITEGTTCITDPQTKRVKIAARRARENTSAWIPTQAERPFSFFYYMTTGDRGSCATNEKPQSSSMPRTKSQ